MFFRFVISMATFLIALFSVVLVLVCLFVTLLVLMQKPSANSGMGAALGGGAAEQAFGGEAGNVLTRGTIYAIILFFVLSFGLYLGTLAASQPQEAASEGASIGKIAEMEANEAATAGEAESAAAEGESSPAIVEEIEAPATDGAESATPNVDEEQETLQLESLDSTPATNGSGS